MKALLISIHPQWVELILNLIKKDEIRKGTRLYKAINKLIKEQGVAPMLIYCTKGNKNECLIPDLQPDKVYHPLTEKLHRGVYSTVEENAIWNDCKKYILNGKVVARFNATADKIMCFIESADSFDGLNEIHNYSAGEASSIVLKERSCLTYEEMLNYLRAVEGECGTAIHINDLEIFDKPKEINEYFKWTDKKIEWYTGLPKCRVVRSLTCAPQSWCYVEI